MDNEAQIEFWNSDVGARWASNHEPLDGMLAPIGLAGIEALALHEQEKQSEGVAVRRNGMRTRLLLEHQTLGKKTFQQRWEIRRCVHDDDSCQRCSSRWTA